MWTKPLRKQRSQTFYYYYMNVKFISTICTFELCLDLVCLYLQTHTYFFKETVKIIMHLKSGTSVCLADKVVFVLWSR